MAVPVTVPSVPNFPFNTNVPASRPTLPSRNSTVPENITEPSSPWVHFASEGLAGPHTFNLRSRSRKEPFPDSRASKRKERSSPFPNVISTFQLPMTFADCAWVQATQHVWKINIRINGCIVFTISSNFDLVYPSSCSALVLISAHDRRSSLLATSKCCTPAGQDEDVF
jgi:hypothetical protein